MLLPNMNLWAYLGLYIECTIGCAAAALYSVTVTPALAVVCPKIFDEGSCPLDKWWLRLPRSEGFWRLWATRITTSRCMMVFFSMVAYVLMASLMYPLMQYSPSFDVETMSLRDDILESQALRHFEDEFNIGILHPVNLVLEAYKVSGSSLPSVRSEADASSVLQGLLRKHPVKLAQRAPADIKTSNEAKTDVNADPYDPFGEPPPKEVQKLAEVDVHTDASPSFLQLEQRKAGSSQDRDGLQPALSAGGRPMTWQDVLYPGADLQGAPELAAAKGNIEGSLNFWKEHDYLARSPAALLKHDYPARCVEQKIYAESERFKDGKDLVFSEQFGKEACSVITSLLSGSKGKPWQVKSDDVLSLWWMPRVPGKYMGVRSAGLLSAPTNMAGKVMRNELMVREMRDSVPDILQQSVSHDGNKVLLMVSNQFRPSSEAAQELDSFVRRLEEKDVARFELDGTQYGIKLRHQSSMQATVDAVGELRHAALRMVAFFLPMVVLAVGVLFVSPFLAVKLVLTVVVPILATYGLAIAVYQMDLLGWTGIKMFTGTGGLDYRLIFITGGVLFGLAMDYDLFLFTRVRELRRDGYDHNSAVRLGLTETGPVTTTAGMVMSLSFFFLAMAHTPFVRMMGFIFFVGTLLDVLVVRMLLAPVLLAIAGSKAYWPAKMPPATKTDETSSPKHA
jgi:preprotein translocase subunit SecF